MHFSALLKQNFKQIFSKHFANSKKSITFAAAFREKANLGIILKIFIKKWQQKLDCKDTVAKGMPITIS